MILISSRLFSDHLLHHGPAASTVVFILFTPQFSAAQRPPSQPPPFFDPLPEQPKFNPSLALLMLIIVGAFFCMGFFSIYIRRCTERRYMRNRGGFNGAVLGAAGRLSRRGQPGLEAAVIGAFPTFLYSAVKGHKIGKVSLECAVCLNEFEDDQTLRLLPKCCHVFHPDCIDAWLASHTTCPVCRADLVPKPGDILFDSESLLQSDNEAQSEFPVRVSDEGSVESIQSPNPPPRSWSTGWRLGGLFPKSRSTGHILVQPGENVDRFTLRLPEEIRNELLNTHLNRAKSAVAFPRATSTKRGYRSKSVGTWRGKNYYYYDRFDQESPPAGGTGIPMKSGSVRSSNEERSSNVSPLKNSNLLRSIKSTVEYHIHGVDKSSSSNRNDAGEASFDRLRPDDVAAGRGGEIV